MISYMIAPLAQNDIDEIWSYIARDSLAAADRLIASSNSALCADHREN